MDFSVGDRVHLVIDKPYGVVPAAAGTCGTVQAVVLDWGYYVVQLDGNSYPSAISAIDLAAGCPTD
jgi:hypothetical protein